MKRGFSLLELLTCISIVVIVAAIAFPAFASAKRAAKQGAAASNLRQLYLAAAMYRTDQGGDSIYGEASQMGLPADVGHFPTPYDMFMKNYQPLWKSPCGLNDSWFHVEPGQTSPKITVVYRPGFNVDTFGQYASTYRENTRLFFDYNCDDQDSPMGNHYLKHRGVAILIEGQLVTPYKPGLMEEDSWWSSPAGG